MAITQDEWLKKRKNNSVTYDNSTSNNNNIAKGTVSQDEWLSKRNLEYTGNISVGSTGSNNKTTYFGENGKIINTNGWKNNKAAAIGATAAETGYNFAKGRTGAGFGESVGDFAANTANESFLGGLFRKAGSAIGTGINYAVTGAHNLFSDDEHDWDYDYANQLKNYDDKEYKKKVREAINEDMLDNVVNGVTGGALNTINDYSLSGDVTDSIIQSVGDSMAQRDLSRVIAGKDPLGNKIIDKNGQIPMQIGKFNIDMPVTSFFSGFTANANDTYAKGGGIGDALIRGTYGGVIESFTEGFNGMYGQGGSSIDRLIDGAVDKIKNNAVRGAASLITNAAEEGFEEGLSYVLNQAGDALYDSISGKKFREKFSGEELGLNMLAGAAAGGLGGFGGALMIANMKPELQQNNPLYGSSQLRQLQEQYEQRLKENEEQLKAWNESPEVTNGTAPRIDENSQDIQDVNKLLARFGINVAYTNDFARLAQQNSNGNVNANNIAGIWSERRNPDGTISRFVKLNPEYTGEDTISQVLMHELTHDIGGSKKFQKIVNSIINNSELSQKFNELSNELAEIYSNLPEYQEAFRSNPEKYQEAFKLKIQEEAVANILSGLGGEETLKYLMSDIKPLQEALGLYTANFKNSLVNSENKFISNLAQSLMKTDKKQASAEQILATVKQALQENYKSRGDNNLYSISGENLNEQNVPQINDNYTDDIKAYNEAANVAKQTEEGEEIKNVHNKKDVVSESDIANSNNQEKYNKHALVLTDTEGNFLPKGVRDNLANVDDYMFEDNRFKNLFHGVGTKGRTVQFNILDNRKGRQYPGLSILFGDHNVVYTSTDPATGSSYARNQGEIPISKKMESIEDVKDVLSEVNKKLNTESYELKVNDDNYEIIRNISKDVVSQEYRSLTKDEKDFLKEVWLHKNSSLSFDRFVRENKFGLGPLFDSFNATVENIEAAARPGHQANEMFEEFRQMLRGTKKPAGLKKKVVATYDSKDSLYRNFLEDIQSENDNLKGRFVYELYGYPENVAVLSPDEEFRNVFEDNPDAANFGEVYRLSEDDKKSPYFNDWWKIVVESRFGRGENEYTLSTDEFVSYIINVVNKMREDAGKKPFDAVAVEDVNDPGIEDNSLIGTDIIFIDSANKLKFTDNEDPHFDDYDLRYSVDISENKNAKDYFKSTVNNPGSKMKDITKKEKAPAPKKEKVKVPTKESIQKQIENGNENIKQMTEDIYSPFDIANSTPEDANVTPNLPNVKRKTGSGKSKFAEQVKKSNFLTQEQKDKLVQDAEINSYEKVNNRDTVNKAIERIDKGYAKEAYDWFNRDKFDAVDMAEGLMYLKLYSESGKYEEMEKVMAKLRETGTTTAQTLQAMSLLSRMTPEGMVYHAEKELDKAWEELKKTKSQEWLRKNSENFHLTNEDIDQIKELTEIASTQTGYDKEVSLALIQKIVTSHIPTTLSTELKSYFRLAMLLNPKTQVRNIAGNAIIAPVNAVSDIFASVFDKAISKKTGYRTVTAMNNQDIKSYISEAKNAWGQAYNEAKLGINTRNDLDRYEGGYGNKPFTEKTVVGKTLNKATTALNFLMDGGDRMFANAEFRTNLDRIMRLNGVTEPTQEMIDLAENESLMRTWNDNNEYTKFVLNVRSGLNNAFGKFKIGNGQFGIGDVLIPFAKTPANLTKAIVDYSPMGFLKAAGMKNELFNKIADGTATLQDQRKFVDTLGKAVAGSLLYVLGYALAKAGILSGEADDDKDVKDFIKNSLGISSYSIKIGDTSFTYDWAQPIAAPFAITSNIVNSKQNADENYGSGFRRALEGFLGSVDSAGAILLDQSFLQSISDVLNNQSGVVSGLVQEVTELPARAVPTFLSQINDLVDDTKRQTFTSKNVLKSSIDYAKSKIPGVSKTLAPSVNTMGKEIKKYGGNNNWFNVFFNPANVNTENMDENAEEIYKIYQSTGDKTIMPSVAPYSDTTTGHIYTPEERAKYQKISGSIISDTVDYLRNYHDDNTGYDYKSLSAQEKADILSKINSFAKQVAKHEVLGTEISSSYKNAYEYYQHGDLGAYYLDPKGSNYALNNPEKYSVVTSTMTYKTYKKHSKAISDLRANTDKDKEETINYINNIPESDFSGGYDDIPVNVKRAMLLKSYYPSYHDYDNQIVSAVIAHCDMSSEKGQEMAIGELKKLGFKNPTIKGGRLYYD